MIGLREKRLGPAKRLHVFVCLVLIFSFGAAGVARAVPSEHSFEIIPGSFHVLPSTRRAGAHEDLTTTFDFAHEGPSEKTDNDLRSTIVNLPPGFTGNNTAVPTCSVGQLLGLEEEADSTKISNCPLASQVGTISLDLTIGPKPARLTFPVFNMQVTSYGTTAELAFPALVFSQVLDVSVRPNDDGLTITAPDTVGVTEPRDISITIWGVPASREHDAERGQVCAPAPLESTNVKCLGGGHPAGIPARPFLSNPTSCEPHNASMEADSWEHSEEFLRTEVEVPVLEECERIQFDPAIEVQPSTRSTESPTGLDVSLVVPQTWESSETLATSNLKDVRLTLPEGVTINPSAGSGLGACTPQQYAAETPFSSPGVGCPPESKIGSIEIETPVLAEKIPGSIYVATPYDNVPAFGSPEHPGGSLLALYIVAKAPDRGIIVKVAGKIEPNPVTGQLVTSFLNNPQQPFSRFTVKFRPGATAPLVSPPVCGTYTTQAQLTPWSAPTEPRLVTSSFETTSGVGGGPCPSGGVPPFKPGILAGTLNNSAGAYSPMDIRITRNDGEQEITRFTSILPPGLTANLTGIPFCPDADIEAAKRVTGAQEEAEPSCPVSSEIGHSLVGAGVGSVLAWTPGKVFMAGPYNGAPFSIVAITRAKVGPFDLGTVVVREALVINPETGIVTVDAKASDPIPHIIDGIVIHVRDIRVYIDRSHFMINPTSCNPMSFAATVGGGGANPANPADQQLATVTNSFQMANCQNLAFKPLFRASTSGETSRQLGASLHVTLAYPKAPQGTQANIRSVKVDLPKQLPSNLPTLNRACLVATFNANPAACPSASRVGTAKAITPILPVPLEGPAYFVSYGGSKFPELIIVLQGYGVTIDLHGETFISKAGITSSTFRSVPDEPVTSFELTLPQGQYPALHANTNLCAITKTVMVKRKVTVRSKGHSRTVTLKVRKRVAGSLVMPTAFTAQNGAVIHQNTPIEVTGCARNKAKKTKAGNASTTQRNAAGRAPARGWVS